MLYNKPKSILEQKLNETLDNKEEKVITDLMKLSLMKSASVDPNLLVYSEIFNLLGLEKFTELISLMDGRTVEFPRKEDFKDSLITIICYYYRTVLNKSWDDIKSLLGQPELNTVKIGIQISQFDKFLQKMIGRISRNG